MVTPDSLETIRESPRRDFLIGDGDLVAGAGMTAFAVHDYVAGEDVCGESFPAGVIEWPVALFHGVMISRYTYRHGGGEEKLVKAREARSGRVMWSVNWGRNTADELAVGEDTVVLSETSPDRRIGTGGLRGLDIESGETRWVANVDTGGGARPICTGDVVWHVERSSDRVPLFFVVCRGLVDGKEVYRHEIQAKHSAGLIAATGKYLLVREGRSLCCYKGA